MVKYIHRYFVVLLQVTAIIFHNYFLKFMLIININNNNKIWSYLTAQGVINNYSNG